MPRWPADGSSGARAGILSATSRPMKIAPSFVLASLRASTYCRKYASAPRLLRPCW
jgi:hypothetical protein